MDTGLSVDYRCVKCRNCVDCKNADETEKVSLRQDVEDAMIKESVELDLPNKRIVAALPLRGKEEEFLSGNRDRALCVLNQQCRKFGNKPEDLEAVLKAFKKLFDRGHVIFLKDLDPSVREIFENKPVQHYIPWRVVYNPKSISTPVRPVMDASLRTPVRADGSGGRCLNDLVCKGRIQTLNLVRMVLGFCIGLFALSGDLSQFYNSVKLKEFYWNLQRILWRPNLDITEEILEAIIITLIYGVKSCTGQTEIAMIKLAELIMDRFPDVAKLILDRRYVDDCGDSKANKKEIDDLAANSDTVFESVGLSCKGWVKSGEDPPVEVSGGEQVIGVGGMLWAPKIDVLMVNIPPLHFGSFRRGRLQEDTLQFTGEFADLENFVPKNLTLRQVTGKTAMIFDIRGFYAPIIAGLRLDIRKVGKLVSGWDDPMPEEWRQKWIQNFWQLEQLRGIGFKRAIMPETATSTQGRLITVVDGAMQVTMNGAYVGFPLKEGGYSCQLIMGKSALADADGTIPKIELNGLCSGSNLKWVIERCLDGWISETILGCDSTIALCWTTSEMKPLAIYHKNRVIQIRRGTDLKDLYHVRTDVNPADVGTRPEKVSVSDVGPGSVWQEGYP